MKVGALGGIAFEVKSSKISTVRSVSWKGSSTYAVHKRHMGKGLVEYTGSDPQTISFSMRLSKSLGSSPSSAISLLKSYEENGTVVQFVLGTKSYGSFIVQTHTVKGEEYTKKGTLIGADISVTIIEYAKR